MKLICLGSADFEAIKLLLDRVYEYENIINDGITSDGVRLDGDPLKLVSLTYNYIVNADTIHLLTISASGTNKWNDIKKQMLELGEPFISESDAVLCYHYFSDGSFVVKELGVMAPGAKNYDIQNSMQIITDCISDAVGDGFHKVYVDTPQRFASVKSFKNQDILTCDVTTVLYIIKE